MDNQNNLPPFIQNAHHKERMLALNKANEYYKEIVESLKADVELAKQNAEEAKKEAIFSRRLACLSLFVATISAIEPFLPYFFNLMQ